MTTPTTGIAALIALDWGTSSLRSYLMAADGQILDSRSSGFGIQCLPQPGLPGFEQAFESVAAEWLATYGPLPVVASGMIGSAQGWREAPYVRCPADVDLLASKSVSVTTAGGTEIRIAPGVLFDVPGEAPDVIRGEEIEIAGAMARAPQWREKCRAVLPGTHSKWVEINAGAVTRFSTFMTGELFAILSKNSILGRLFPDPQAAAPNADGTKVSESFIAGARAAAADHAKGLTHIIFSARTLGLTGRMPAAELSDYLSGLLIGYEVTAALALNRSPVAAPDAPILLIGAGSLCRRYAAAFDALGIEVAATLNNSAPVGLLNFARSAGVLANVPEAENVQ